MQPLHSYFRQLAICKLRFTSKFTTLDTLTYQIHLAVKTKNDPNISKNITKLDNFPTSILNLSRKDLKIIIFAFMKIGVIKEGKIPPDERVPLSPSQCKEIAENFPSIELVVQNSDVRRYKVSEYESLGIKMVDSVDDCDVF